MYIQPGTPSTSGVSTTVSNPLVGISPVVNGDVLKVCPTGVPPTKYLEPLSTKDWPSAALRG
jgi:hypothetical protein